jgi:hypothetical protein
VLVPLELKYTSFRLLLNKKGLQGIIVKLDYIIMAPIHNIQIKFTEGV